MSYIVRGRSQEIAIRTTLGARGSDVVRLVLIEGIWPAGIGIVVGAAGALVSAQLLQSMVFGVSASDPATLIMVSAALAAVALLASLVPAWRATRLDPLRLLRPN
jgi:putative ABC transport system permease protein